MGHLVRIKLASNSLLNLLSNNANCNACSTPSWFLSTIMVSTMWCTLDVLYHIYICCKHKTNSCVTKKVFIKWWLWRQALFQSQFIDPKCPICILQYHQTLLGGGYHIMRMLDQNLPCCVIFYCIHNFPANVKDLSNKALI